MSKKIIECSIETLEIGRCYVDAISMDVVCPSCGEKMSRTFRGEYISEPTPEDLDLRVICSKCKDEFVIEAEIKPVSFTVEYNSSVIVG